MSKQKNLFITIEGIEGVGKSTMLNFITTWLTRRGVDVLGTREPGGSEIAEAIRQVLLHHYDEAMTVETELLLMFAGRAQHLSAKILPALATGKWVICDRFTDASYAYQGGGRFVDETHIAHLESWLQKELRPDITLLLDAPVDMSVERMSKRHAKDRFEQESIDFFNRVRQCYLDRAARYKDRYHIIDATQSAVKVQQQIAAILEPYLEPIHNA